jgi:two-component system, cell cycle sensor histidine kinase and response regulator CckA
MAEKDPSSEDQAFGSSLASHLGLSTETIDIDGPLFEQVTKSGSFDLRGFGLTSAGRILNAIPTPALLIDTHFSIIFANDSSQRIVKDISGIQAAPFCSLFPRPGDAAKFQRILQKVFSTRKLRMGEGVVEVGTSRLWGRMSFRSVRIGQVRFVLVLIEDLTLEKKQLLLIETHKERFRQEKAKFENQLKERTAELELINERLSEEIEERTRTQRALEKSRESFRSIVEETSDGIAVVDSQGTILYANPIAAFFFDRTPKSLIGARLSVSPVPGRINEVEIRRRTGNQGIGEMRVSRTQWHGKLAYLVVIHDITNRKRAEQGLLRAQKVESLELIAGGLAHDFNNLLTANVANISLAKIRSESGSPVYDALIKAEKAASKARDLTRQLLTFAKGKAPVKTLSALGVLLRDSITLALSGSNVKCDLKIAEDLWTTEVEPSQISMVFQNLLINAQQAMPKGGTVTVRAENIVMAAESRDQDAAMLEGRYVRVTIKDTGSGIPAECLSKIFDPYFTTKATGSGLGLATSYEVLKKHNGRIEVESRVGEGAQFHVYLPASDQSVRAAESSDQSLVRGKGKILIMDDEESIREATSDLATLMGYEVVTVENGALAIEQYRSAMSSQRPFSAVIMDLTIPGEMGGAEVIQKLLEIDPEAKVIVCSGHVDEPIMIDYKRHGFIGAMAKPYSAKELGEALRNAILGEKNSHD